jgi:thiol-disulfide isomerase/thioredoxin
MVCALAATIVLLASPATEDVKAIARGVVERYREAQGLSFELLVTETVKKPDGVLAGPQHRARAVVVMAAGDRVRSMIYEPGKPDPIFNTACDGKMATEWTTRQWASYPQVFAGNEHVEVDFDLCYVGSCLWHSWVGGDTGRAAMLDERVGHGRYQGTERIDGIPCHVVVYERWLPNEEGIPNRFLIQDTFYVDPKQWFVLQWTTMQADVDESGEIASHITRQRRYRNIRTDLPPASVFEPKPPAGCVEVTARTPALLLGKRFPPLSTTRWIQGRETLGLAERGEIRTFGDKVVLLDFMFTECPPCRAALPQLTKLHERYAGRGFVVLSLCASWGTEGLESLVKELKVKHAIGVLGEGVEQSYFVLGYPLYVLIDRMGVVRWVGVGDGPEGAQIERLLGNGQ